MFWAAVGHFFVSLTTFLVKKREETTSLVKHITHTHKKNDDDDDFEENFEQRSLLLCPLLRRENCFCRPGIILFTRSFCLFIVFFFSIIFPLIIIIVAFWRLWFFFSHRRSPLAPLPARRRLRRVLSVCRGRSRFEGCFSRKFFFFFFFSTKTEDWRKKWVLLNDVGKNTNHFIETLFSRGVKNTNHQNVCFSSLMTQHRRKNTMTMI